MNFISSKDSNETSTVYLINDDTEIMISYGTDEIIEELSESLLQKHQKRLEKKITGSEFIFDSVDLLYSLNRDGSYTDSPK